MLSPSDVTAVIVTRGDVDLGPVLESLVFPQILVWNNSIEDDYKTWGRYAGLARAKNRVYYSQDDDIVHTRENQLRIISHYEPGVLTGCMWQEWSDGARQQGIEDGYDDLVFAGSGSVFDYDTPVDAAHAYRDVYTDDGDFFRLWADTIIGVIAPTTQLDIRFQALPCAENDNRMCNLPHAVQEKALAIGRARLVRDCAVTVL